MEKNLRAKNLVDQVKGITGRDLSLDEASQLLMYEEVELERAVDILSGNVAKGTVIGNAFRYLSQILANPAPVYKKKEPVRKQAYKTVNIVVPKCYTLEDMPRLSTQEAFRQIEEIEKCDRAPWIKLLGEETAQKLRHRVCNNIASRIDPWLDEE